MKNIIKENESSKERKLIKIVQKFLLEIQFLFIIFFSLNFYQEIVIVHFPEFFFIFGDLPKHFPVN